MMTSIKTLDFANFRNFLISLVTFPKILICGVNGPAKNLAVTMLTLFDVVCATEKATFKTDYGNIGQIPEGLSLMSITGKVRGSTVSFSLFWHFLSTFSPFSFSRSPFQSTDILHFHFTKFCKFLISFLSISDKSAPLLGRNIISRRSEASRSGNKNFTLC